VVALLAGSAILALAAALAGVAAGRASRPSGVTFYVDSTRGSDQDAGTSPAAPWRTLARASVGRYRGGDWLLLHGHFSGTLRLSGSNVMHTRRATFTISSYGGGRALIAPAAGADAILVRNASGVRVDGLDLVGRDRACRRHTAGVLFDGRGGGRLAAGVTVERVDVHSFCFGVEIGIDDQRTVFDHVLISHVVAHDNGDAGVMTYDQSWGPHRVRDVTVSDVRAYRNAQEGGIVLFGVERGTVEHSVAFANGRGNSGAVGIWAFDADRILLTHDESYGNLTTGDDGDGFDFDGGVTNSRMSYDYSHGNQGVGFLVCACVVPFAQHGDVIDHDVSIHDGSSGQTSGIYVGGGQPFSNVRVFDNSVSSAAGSGPLIDVDGDGSSFADVHLWDNVFEASAGKAMLYADTADGTRMTFEADRWDACGGRFALRWGRTWFTSLAAWRAQTGMERTPPPPTEPTCPTARSAARTPTVRQARGRDLRR
jgi:hypothetical protein